MTATVGVVGIVGDEHLDRCLAALADQDSAPLFETVVAMPERLGWVDGLARPGVRVVRLPSPAPPHLATSIVREALGEHVLLIEDHCEPGPTWVRDLVAALVPGRGAAGGPVSAAPDASLVDWAFWLSDFYRVAPPAVPGPARGLSVSNVAYRRRDLDALEPAWRAGFVEAAVHDALARRVGPLWMVPGAVAVSGRRVRVRDGLRERASFGWLHGSVVAESPARAALAPAVPFVLLARMARVALPSPALRGRFLATLPLLLAFAAAWAWGEACGRLSGRAPGALRVAPSPGWQTAGPPR